MNILGKDIDTDKRLKIGSFMMDTSAEAVLDGNKFFQRHAAVWEVQDREKLVCGKYIRKSK